MKKFRLLMIALIFMTANCPAAYFIVDRFEDAPDVAPGDGFCIGQNMVGDVCSLRAAINETNALPGADTILVTAGEYELSIDGQNDDSGWSGDLDITDEVLIINGTSGLIINAHAIDRIFHIHSGGKLTLNNTTLKNGVANTQSTFEGGAVKVEDGGIFHTNEVTFVNNLANRGGALFSDGDVIIENSYFHHNAVTNENTPIHLNSLGSAILNRKDMIFATSTLAHNGQLLTNPGNAPLTDSQYALHINPNGINAAPPISFIFNSTIATNGYGGIRSDRGFTDINQSTIANHASQGLRFSRNTNHAGELQLRIQRTLMVNNGFQDCNDAWVIPGDEADIGNNHNASSDESCGFTGANDIQNIPDPLNGSLHNWGGYAPTLLLKHNSLAVDMAGNDCSDEDQRGTARPLDGNNNQIPECDIGSFELNNQTDPTQSDLIFKNGFEALL